MREEDDISAPIRCNLIPSISGKTGRPFLCFVRLRFRLRTASHTIKAW